MSDNKSVHIDPNVNVINYTPSLSQLTPSDPNPPSIQLTNFASSSTSATGTRSSRTVSDTGDDILALNQGLFVSEIFHFLFVCCKGQEDTDEEENENGDDKEEDADDAALRDAEAKALAVTDNALAAAGVDSQDSQAQATTSNAVATPAPASGVSLPTLQRDKSGSNATPPMSPRDPRITSTLLSPDSKDSTMSQSSSTRKQRQRKRRAKPSCWSKFLQCHFACACCDCMPAGFQEVLCLFLVCSPFIAAAVLLRIFDVDTRLASVLLYRWFIFIVAVIAGWQVSRWLSVVLFYIFASIVHIPHAYTDLPAQSELPLTRILWVITWMVTWDLNILRAPDNEGDVEVRFFPSHTYSIHTYILRVISSRIMHFLYTFHCFILISFFGHVRTYANGSMHVCARI